MLEMSVESDHGWHQHNWTETGAKELRMSMRLGVLLLGMAVLAGCTARRVKEAGPMGLEPVTVPEDVALQRIETLMTALRGAGATAEYLGTSPESIFLAPMMHLLLDGEDVTVYAYADAESRQVVSEWLSADGSELQVRTGANGEITTTIIDWADVPNFWASQHLLIQYIGESQPIIDLMTRLYGSPITDGSGASPQR